MCRERGAQSPDADRGGVAGGRCRIPGAAALLGRIGTCLAKMLAPVELAQQIGMESAAARRAQSGCGRTPERGAASIAAR